MRTWRRFFRRNPEVAIAAAFATVFLVGSYVKGFFPEQRPRLLAPAPAAKTVDPAPADDDEVSQEEFDAEFWKAPPLDPTSWADPRC